MKPTFIALSALCLCLPLVSAEREQILNLKVKAATGDARAQWALVTLFQSKNKKGEKENQQDYDEAIIIQRKWADKNQAAAQHALGLMYRHGFGVKADNIEALKWARKAAKQNYVPALNDVGYAYDSGLGVAKDDVAALGWYLKAMKHGSAAGWTPLVIGNLHQYGQGVDRNPVTALAWYNISTFPQAKLEKAKLMKKMTPDQIAAARVLSKQLIKKYQMDSDI